MKKKKHHPLCTESLRKFSATCGRRLNIGLMLLKPLVALTLNFINDNLLFIKLFQLVFQLIRVL